MQRDMRLYLGLDVGGTKTQALIADQAGHIRGMGRRGPGNWEVVGLEGTYHTLAQALNEALTNAGLSVVETNPAIRNRAAADKTRKGVVK
jgi:N-acetylglucosamine kinase-like BadF-type ATPase